MTNFVLLCIMKMLTLFNKNLRKKMRRYYLCQTFFILSCAEFVPIVYLEVSYIAADKYTELARFFAKTTELTMTQALFLAENSYDYWSSVRDELVDIFALIKSTKITLKKMEIE